MPEQIPLDAETIVADLLDEVSTVHRQRAWDTVTFKAQIRKLAADLEDMTKQRDNALAKSRGGSVDDTE